MEVVRTGLFVRSLRKLNVSKSDLEKLERHLVTFPEAGDVIPGLGGARKIRFAMAGRGKQGGGRAIYVVVWRRGTAYLLMAYDKREKTDLTAEDRKVLLPLVRSLTDG